MKCITNLFFSENKNEEKIEVEDLVLKVKENIKKDNLEEFNSAVTDLVWADIDISEHIDLLNELLLNKSHRQHQYIAKRIQSLKTPSSIPFIDKVLESKFEGIPYTGSDSYSMAKWFSWALYEIGTKEAFAVLGKHTNSEDKGIKYEMRYRLKKAQAEGKLK